MLTRILSHAPVVSQPPPPIRNAPMDARAYLLDLSSLAHEVATSSDPRVISGGLGVLALQAEFLAAAVRGAK